MVVHTLLAALMIDMARWKMVHIVSVGPRIGKVHLKMDTLAALANPPNKDIGNTVIDRSYLVLPFASTFAQATSDSLVTLYHTGSGKNSNIPLCLTFGDKSSVSGLEKCPGCHPERSARSDCARQSGGLTAMISLARRPDPSLRSG